MSKNTGHYFTNKTVLNIWLGLTMTSADKTHSVTFMQAYQQKIYYSIVYQGLMRTWHFYKLFAIIKLHGTVIRVYSTIPLLQLIKRTQKLSVHMRPDNRYLAAYGQKNYLWLCILWRMDITLYSSKFCSTTTLNNNCA